MLSSRVLLWRLLGGLLWLAPLLGHPGRRLRVTRKLLPSRLLLWRLLGRLL